MGPVRGGIPQNPQQEAEKESRARETANWDKFSYRDLATNELKRGGVSWKFEAVEDLADLEGYNRKEEEKKLGIGGMGVVPGRTQMPKPGLYVRTLEGATVKQTDAEKLKMYLEKNDNGTYTLTRVPMVHLLPTADPETPGGMISWLSVGMFGPNYNNYMQAKSDEFDAYKTELGLSTIVMGMPGGVNVEDYLSDMDMKAVWKVMALAGEKGMAFEFDADLTRFLAMRHPDEFIKLQAYSSRLEENRLQREILANVSTVDDTRKFNQLLNDKPTIVQEFNAADTADAQDKLKKSVKADDNAILDLAKIEEDMKNHLQIRVENLEDAAKHADKKQDAFRGIMQQTTRVKKETTGEFEKENGHYKYEYGKQRGAEEIARRLIREPLSVYDRAKSARHERRIKRDPKGEPIVPNVSRSAKEKAERKALLSNPVAAVKEIKDHFKATSIEIDHLLNASTKEVEDIENRLAVWKEVLAKEKTTLTDENALPATSAEKKAENASRLEKVSELLKNAADMENTLTKNKAAVAEIKDKKDKQIPDLIKSAKEEAKLPEGRRQHGNYGN